MTNTFLVYKYRLAMQKTFLALSCFLFLFLPYTAQATPLLLTENPKANPALLQRLLKHIDTQQGLVIDIQRELVSRPAVNPDQGGTGEAAKAKWIESWLMERGFVVENFDFPDERVPEKNRPNLVAVFPEKAEQTTSGRTLWLLGHMDVAAPGPLELWSSSPFALRVDGDMLYGRGVEDNNQAISVALLLAESIQKQNLQPPMRLGMVFVSGGLTSFAVGIDHVLSTKADLFAPDDIIVLMDYGNPQGSAIGIAEKGQLWMRVTVTGKEGHAASPQKARNSLAAAATLMEKLRTLPAAFPEENSLFIPPHSTFTPTITDTPSSRDFGPNHIPPSFVFYIDSRILPGYTIDAVTNKIRSLADEVEKAEGVHILLEWDKDTTAPANATPKNAPVLQGLARAVQTELKVEPQFVGTSGMTVAAKIRELGLPVAVWGIQTINRNAPDESASIKAHLKQARVLVRLLFDPALLVKIPPTDAQKISASPSL